MRMMWVSTWISDHLRNNFRNCGCVLWKDLLELTSAERIFENTVAKGGTVRSEEAWDRVRASWQKQSSDLDLVKSILTHMGFDCSSLNTKPFTFLWFLCFTKPAGPVQSFTFSHMLMVYCASQIQRVQSSFAITLLTVLVLTETRARRCCY